MTSPKHPSCHSKSPPCLLQRYIIFQSVKTPGHFHTLIKNSQKANSVLYKLEQVSAVVSLFCACAQRAQCKLLQKERRNLELVWQLFEITLDAEETHFSYLEKQKIYNHSLCALHIKIFLQIPALCTVQSVFCVQVLSDLLLFFFFKKIGHSRMKKNSGALKKCLTFLMLQLSVYQVIAVVICLEVMNTQSTCLLLQQNCLELTKNWLEPEASNSAYCTISFTDTQKVIAVTKANGPGRHRVYAKYSKLRNFRDTQA